MSAALIISIFLIVAVTFVLYRTKRRSLSSGREPEFFQRTSPGLFDDGRAEGSRREGATISGVLPVSEERAREILTRAEAGDLSSLREALEAGDKKLYDQTLDALLMRRKTDDNVLDVAAYVIKNDGLRSNHLLTNGLRIVWKLTPERVGAADLLRVAALSGDAALFHEVVEDVASAFEDSRGWAGTGEGLRQLIESEYWVLSSDARRSGAGFLLKQKLAEVGPRLAAVRRRETLSAGPVE